ncbi:unnamed protein product [Rhizoctonia solani]|uniref:F-box domain-containing protein n=1 Tax=Rhizoctonia solani TaxID=456999 RepID=A0A8H3BX06_9AGAM|nr:unnamed protein product [Rhizoctonia solani]
MSTRTSARLAKRKGRSIKVDMVDAQDDVGRDGNFKEVESDQEEQRPPPRKRQRITTTKSTKAAPRKKLVRGKQGRLADLVNMPVDIFTEVASHLLPGDIISLSRANKFFRNLLMHRSAIHIWHGSMKNVQGLPPCPEGMSEPHFLALLFSKTCSMCGSPVRTNMDPFLLVKLCGSCRNTLLMPLISVPPSLISWIDYSRSIAPTKRRTAWAYVLRKDVDDLTAQYDEKHGSKDAHVLEAWIQERREGVAARRNRGLVIAEFLENLERGREREISDIKAARRSEVKRRLAEMGWTETDMEFGWWALREQRDWNDLVSQPKPLTERIWTNIQPKLIPLLEANREARLQMERDSRKSQRQLRLSELFLEIKQKDPSVLQLKAPNPVTRLTNAGSTISFTYRNPFPDLCHALHWPLVKDLYETDSTVEEMEARFEEKREEVEGLVTEWQNRIQSQVVGRLREGYTSQGETIRPTITVSNEGPDPLANVSDDLKLLLRADSFFYDTQTFSSLKVPVSFSTMISSAGLSGSLSAYASVIPRPVPNLDHYQWYPEAHEAARELLADMGRPDASYLEMKGVGSAFACGRCHETDSRNWEKMVEHYVEQKRLHAKIQESIATMSDAGIIYNNVHDPALLVGQPLVTDYATKTLDAVSDPGPGRRQVCNLCEEIPTAREVTAYKPGIVKHLLDVHGITEPKAEEHYAPKVFNPSLFGMGEYDSDDDYGMSFGCSCPFHQMFGDDDYGYDEDMYEHGDLYGYDDDVYGYDNDMYGFDDEDDYW